jgi:putative SOS response-associated peptidase YedK
MCYYNGQKVTHTEFIRLKGIEKLVANYDFLNRDLNKGFDYGNTAVLRPYTGESIDFDLTEMEWGFLPDTWYGKALDTREKVNVFRNGYKNAQGKFIQGITTLNAMGEELLLPGKIYRESALSRRCLILSSGFYEWHHYYGINKKTGLPLKTESTVPYHISLKDKNYFYMAGIWKPWTDQVTGEYVETCSIITTSAIGNPMMEFVHNTKKRMPTILNEDLGYEWMFGNLSEERITELATTQYNWKEMQAWTIDKKFRDSFDPTEPYVYPEDVPSLEKYLAMAG